MRGLGDPCRNPQQHSPDGFRQFFFHIKGYYALICRQGLPVPTTTPSSSEIEKPLLLCTLSMDKRCRNHPASATRRIPTIFFHIKGHDAKICHQGSPATHYPTNFETKVERAVSPPMHFSCFFRLVPMGGHCRACLSGHS
ncbi:hypothetical protein AVEN_60723-1 [Araneus ventricosus]|uniref:Uncharacterized protein n=1 Tax=Araneus ventricosus TaxID=182803 RepID=A0A4Y2V2M0_ARAVE|nr:hypothetical protein AVEN_60723-1 [Araneus ventricosus]